MIRLIRHHGARIVAAHFLAAVVGIGLAVSGAPIPFSSDAQATATDCTRYAPSLKPPNVNCDINNLIGSGYHQWTTPGTALRDRNYVRTTSDRDLYVEYVNTNIYAFGTGTYLQIASSLGTYRQARCEESWDAVYMNCTTDWH